MNDILGLVLLGGRSRRMGRDKAFLSYHENPQWLHCMNLLKCAGIGHVFLSGQADQRNLYPETISWLSDPFPNEGPMAGILYGLSESKGRAVLALPIDMPAVRYQTIQLLIEGRNSQHPATVFALPEPGNIHPLLAIWEPHILPAMEIAWEDGQRSPRKFLQSQSIQIIHGLSVSEARNVNRPEDWSL